MEKILPIGSIVRLIDGEDKLMIINRVPLFNNNGTLGYFEYSGCLYPYGQTGQNVYFFNKENIKELIFEGYRDEDEESFCKKYYEKIEKIPYPRFEIKLEKSEDSAV